MPLHGEPFTGPIPKPQSRAAQKKASDRTREREWQKVRKAVLVRDGYRCRSCGTPEKVDVHHIRFRSMGGADTSENLCALCRICHLEMHAYRMYAEGNDANKKLRFIRSK
jgi:5-methylcytosine-specific restriction endonuclease McrA